MTTRLLFLAALVSLAGPAVHAQDQAGTKAAPFLLLGTDARGTALGSAQGASATGPAALYVSGYERSRQTAAPLAARLGLQPIVYDPADTDALLMRVRSGPRPAMIVGHSNTVPDIVERLGGARPAPLVHEDFGDIWVLSSDGTERQRIEVPGHAR